MKKLLINTVYSLYVCCMAILMLFGITACSGDDKPFVDNEPVAVKGGGDIVKGISVTLSDFESADVKTRTTYSDVDGGIKVTWAAGDTIGIFPNEGGQVEFPIQAGTESNEATFDGGGWALRATSTYAAYYPYSKWNVFRDNETILLDYTGQAQADNGITDHLGQYDYQATGGVQTNSSGYLNFQFKHLGALMVFNLTIPKAGTYTSLTLTSSEDVFVTKAELDISGNEPMLKPIETSKTITLRLDDIELESDNSELTAYMMLAPTDLSQGSLELKIDGDRIFTTTLDGHDLEGGKQYTIEKAFVDNTPSYDQIIDFADDEVKAICVANWDTNKDGELSYAEAAAVTDIGRKFESNKNIIKFDEFQYFTGVTSISSGGLSFLKGAFDACSSLTCITLPEGMTSIGNYAFYYCSSLTSIEIPEGVTSIGESAFRGCSRLTSIKIPECVTSIDHSAFSGCSSLTSIEIPGGVTSIGQFTFFNCSSLTNIEIPEGVTSIGDNAFTHCSSLTSIEIPKGVTSINGWVFENCSNLTSIVIPEGVTSIGKEAFWDCSSLTSIEIPEGVTSIGESAFRGCSRLTSFTCLATNPPALGSDAFYQVPDTIYVPASSVDAYKAADGWKDYASQIQAIQE